MVEEKCVLYGSFLEEVVVRVCALIATVCVCVFGRPSATAMCGLLAFLGCLCSTYLMHVIMTCDRRVYCLLPHVTATVDTYAPRVWLAPSDGRISTRSGAG